MMHKTVLLHEAVDGLELSSESIVVDATFGSGGHAREIVSKLGKDGVYIGIDADKTAFAGQSLGSPKATIHLVNDNFKNITNILSSLHIEKVDAILADLGWRMEQFSGSGKGFSFNVDEPLHMTFGDPADYPFTAHDIINDWKEETLANIFYGYAEERSSRRIARAIVEARENEIISTTFQLRDIVTRALPKSAGYKKTHPATKVFQAMRIAVNNELGVLESFLKDAFNHLEDEGKLAIISFHSIEDRIVKHYFRELVEAGAAEYAPKKPISASDDELMENPRARSAKLRIIRKID
jgi:16S rRNA (cytosine1402-N4)-methyltransferase